MSLLDESVDDEMDQEMEPRGRRRSSSFIDDEDGEQAKPKPQFEPDFWSSSRAARVQLSKKTLDIVTNLDVNHEHLQVRRNTFDEAFPQHHTLEALQAQEEEQLALEEKRLQAEQDAKRATKKKAIGIKRFSNADPGPDVFDVYAKVLLLGESGVGKTSLMTRFADNYFKADMMMTTGVDFKVRLLDNVQGKRVKCQVWDTAGQDRFHVVTRAYYKGAQGIALVYDVTNPSSLEHVGYWMDNIKKYANSGVSVVLVGNKIDKSNRKVNSKEAHQVAQKFGVKHFDCSAKSGSNVVQAFTSVAQDIVKKAGDTKSGEARKQDPIKLDKPRKKTNCSIL